MRRLTQIKLRRIERGLLQIELAQRARINRCRLSELECGHLQPGAEELQRLATALGVPITALTDAAQERAA